MRFANDNKDLSAPVLLQKILQSMENPKSPTSAVFIYSSITLLVRLVASQCSVFGLWYQRRAFERSRGEMITMLYEKALSRKVVSVSAKPPPEEGSSDLNGLNGSNGTVDGKKNSPIRKFIGYIMKPFNFFRATYKVKKPVDKAKDFATMGKIMNLMR